MKVGNIRVRESYEMETVRSETKRNGDSENWRHWEISTVVKKDDDELGIKISEEQ